MNRALLVSLATLLLVGLPRAARAAEPADPFASPSEGKEPTSTEEQEAEVLGAPSRPPPAAEPAQPPPPPPRPAAPARRPAAASRRQANDDERTAVAGQTGLAIELSTSSFASGALQGGLFVGGRTESGLILGGLFDYALVTASETPAGASAAVSTSAQQLRVGAGARLSFLQSADRVIDLYGAADASFEYVSADVVSGGPAPTHSVSASGFSLAAGPGLRLWVHSQIAIGYVARLRLTYLSGSAGVLVTALPTDDTNDASRTQIGFDGTFQILGVF